MKADMILKRKEDAVSPVIGVMLMLVVTIVIAAVVAAFAGGLGSDVEMAPTAVLDIDAHANGKLKIAHLSGDSLSEKDITIKVTDASGNSLGSGAFDLEDNYLSPGMTTVVQLKNGENNLETLSSVGKYVTVTVMHNGKNVIMTKDVLVKATLS